MRVKKFINFTVWTNYNCQIENPYNLYASYKVLSDILKFMKINSKLNFEVFYRYFCYGDRRDKLLMFKKIIKKLITKIVSKNFILIY